MANNTLTENTVMDVLGDQAANVRELLVNLWRDRSQSFELAQVNDDSRTILDQGIQEIASMGSVVSNINVGYLKVTTPKLSELTEKSVAGMLVFFNEVCTQRQRGEYDLVFYCPFMDTTDPEAPCYPRVLQRLTSAPDRVEQDFRNALQRLLDTFKTQQSQTV